MSTNIIFLVLVILAVAIVVIFTFFVINNIRNKTQNQEEARKVITFITIACFLSLTIFGWNTFSLVNSINNLDNSKRINITPEPNKVVPEINKPQEVKPSTKDNYFNY